MFRSKETHSMSSTRRVAAHDARYPSRQRRRHQPVYRRDRVRDVPFKDARAALRGEKRVRRDAEGGVIVKPAPAAAFEVIEPDLVLELLVVPLDTPTQLRQPDHVRPRRRRPSVDSQYFVGAASRIPFERKYFTR